MALDADLLATGHYGRVRRDGDVFQLLRGVDGSKDQSYVLYTLKQAELARLIFPVGGYLKTDVRRLALEMGLPLHDKPDSAEICFVPNNDYRTFLEERMESTPGAIVDREGAVVGRHDGVSGFTIGQRKGLGAFGGKRYVTAIAPEQNLIEIGDEDDLFSRYLVAEDASWTEGAPPAASFRAEVKVRYKSLPEPATVHVRGTDVEVEFDRNLRAITPGQASVFYHGERVIGGAVIARSGSRAPAAGAGGSSGLPA
jgi:tRNA-specific 2-thiouridylase